MDAWFQDGFFALLNSDSCMKHGGANFEGLGKKKKIYRENVCRGRSMLTGGLEKAVVRRIKKRSIN